MAAEFDDLDLEGQRWRIFASNTLFTELKEDSQFRAIVKLARAANAVTFCQLILVESTEDSPRSQRNRFNAFLYAGRVLYEAWELAKLLGRDLREYPAFEEQFKPLFRDRAASEFVEKVLKRIRNEGVFHFTAEEIPDGLHGLTRDEYTFVVGDGAKVADAYHILADEAVIRAGFGVTGSEPEVVAALRPFVAQAADLSVRFSAAAEQLIAEVLLNKGWSLEILREADGES